jgi:hypothetical protein
MAQNIESRIAAVPPPSVNPIHYFRSELSALLVAMGVMMYVDEARSRLVAVEEYSCPHEIRAEGISSAR